MVKACCAPGCKYQYMKGDGLKMHCLPSDMELREKWLAAMHKPDSNPLALGVVCSQHFQKSCYQSYADGKIKLKSDAVPTIFYESKSIRPVLKEAALTLHIANEEEFTTQFVIEEVDDAVVCNLTRQEEVEVHQQPKKRKQPHFLGDFRYEDLECPIQRYKFWLMAHKVNEIQKIKLKYYMRRTRILEEQVKSLQAKEVAKDRKKQKKLIFTV